MTDPNADITNLLREQREQDQQHWQDEPLRDVVAATFQGRRRRFVLLLMVFLLLYTVLAVASTIAFFQAEAVRDQIMYASGVIIFIIAIVGIKIWYWMEMNKYSLAREMKRMELQIARLAEGRH